MAQLVKISQRSSIMGFLKSNIRAFSTPANPPKPTEDPAHILSTKTHKINDFEKKLLVWSGKYQTKEEVPTYVSPEAVEKARNKFRIRVANYMILLTFIGCGYMIFSGKKAVEKGESVLKMNQDWHTEYNQKSIEEATAKANK